MAPAAKQTSSGAVGIVRLLPPPPSSLQDVLMWILQREHSASITAPPHPYPQSDTLKAQNIIEIDCRGLEFTEFKADGEWLAIGTESGTKFEKIDLSEGEWFDYDEKAGEEVSVKDIKWEIRRA